MLKAIETGWVQRQIQESAYRFQRRVETKDFVWVGLNDFKVEEPAAVEIAKPDPALERGQVARLKALKARRDNARVREALDALAKAARGSDNLLPFILDAVKAYATTGEVCNTLREVWGEYKPPADV